jgi:hypothetical protein
MAPELSANRKDPASTAGLVPVFSAPSSPCSRPPNFSQPGGTVFYGSAVDSLAPEDGFFTSEHKLQPSRFTEVSISTA